MQKISLEELDDIAFYCQEVSNIDSVYGELRERHSKSSGEELRDLFLWCIQEFMKQGRLRFLGEGWIKDGIEPDAPFMFGDSRFPRCSG